MIRTKKYALLLALFFVPFLRAEDPPQNSINLKIDFSKTTGLNDFLTSDKINDTDAQVVRNIDYIKNGNMTPRNGFIEYTNTAFAQSNYHGNFLGVFVSTNSNKYLISNIEQKLSYFVTTTPGPDANITGPTGQTQTFKYPIDGLNWNGYFYIISQDTVALKIGEITGTGVSFVYSTSVPQGQYAQSHIDRMLVAGSTNTPLRLFYSYPDDADDFPPINYLDITGVKEYDIITGLGPTLLGNLPIYTNNTTRLLTGTEFPNYDTGGNVGVRVVSDNIGCIHHRTIKNVNNRQYFYSKGSNQTNPGIYRFNGISVQEVTKGARNLFLTLNTSTFPIPNAYVYKDTYCLNLASANGIVNNYQVCVDDKDRISFYQLGLNPGTPFADNAVDMVRVIDNSVYAVTGQPYQSDLRRKIYKLSSSAEDYGSRIYWRYKTKDFDMGNESRPKVAQRAYVSSAWNSSSFTVLANMDFGNSTYSWTIISSTTYKQPDIQTVLFSSGNVINRLTFPSGKQRFNYINFDFTGSNYNSSIDYLDFYATPEPLR